MVKIGFENPPFFNDAKVRKKLFVHLYTVITILLEGVDRKNL